MSAVREYLQKHREANLDELIEFLKIPSISTLKQNIPEAAGHLAGLMQKAGIAPKIMPTAGLPAVCGEAKGPAGAPTLLVYGHYDVQPADPAEGWTSPPFEPEVRGGRLYARGAGDNKGQHIAQIQAAGAFTATNTPLPLTVKFLIEGEEEMGSTNLRQFVREHKDLLQADFACSSDGSLHPSGRPTLALGCRGLLYIELVSQGVGKDLHSGSYGVAVASPAWRLMEAVQCLRDEAGRVRVPGFYEAIRPLTDADQKALAEIPDPMGELAAALGDGVSRIPEPDLFYEKTLSQAGVNICGFQGGYSGDGVKTVIPGEIRAKVDFRLVVDQDPEKIFDDVREFLKKEGFADIEVRKLALFQPSKTPADHPFVKKVAGAIEAYGETPVIYPNLGGSVPDDIFTKELGIPSIWLPFANADTNSHAPDENLRLDLFHRSAEIAAAVMEGLAG